MVKRFQVLNLYLFFTLSVCVFHSGCTQSLQTSAPPAQTYPQLKVVGILAGRYLSANNSRPPQKREDLISFLNDMPEEWQGLGMNTVEEFLTSPHDGQPLIIVVGKSFGALSPSGLPWVAYEQTGVDGRLLAINARGGVTEMSAEELHEIFPQS